MKTQFRIAKNFTVRDPETGRQRVFKKGEIAKGVQIKFATDARIADGRFIVEAIEPKDASIVRRFEGRAAWHLENGTDCEMDMEYVTLSILARHFGDALRSKGSGQTSIFSAVSAAYLKEFEGQITVELIDGSDDPFAHRNIQAWRGLNWANTQDVALRCSAFIMNYVLNKY